MESTVTTHAVEELDARADNLVTCIASDTEIECGITFVHKDLDWASSNVESNAFGYLSCKEICLLFLNNICL